MKKNLHWILLASIVLLFVIILSIKKPSGKLAPENLSVQATPNQTGPQIIAQNPGAGQRLDLSPTIQLTFDRDMDRYKTGKAFSLLGPDGQPVSGQPAWRDARTFEFSPASKLESASNYIGVFSTSAIALDGTSPKENIELNFRSE